VAVDCAGATGTRNANRAPKFARSATYPWYTFTPPSTALHDVPIQRRLVTHSEQILLAVLLSHLRLAHLVPLLVQRPISPAQQQRRNDTRHQDTQTEAIPEPVFRSLLLQEDILPDRTTQVANGNEQSHTHGALPGRRKIIADPAEDINDGRIHARRDGEEESVGKTWISWVWDCEECDKCVGSHREWPNDVRPASLVSVG
jgi:hypothetical protein